MADSENYSRFLNPCLLHLQKMELELKCAVCLDLLTRPVLLPCIHIFCSLNRTALILESFLSHHKDQQIATTIIPHMMFLLSLETANGQTILSCIPSTVEVEFSCTVCKLPCQHQDLRPAQHIENMVSIYKSMYAVFGANLSHSVPQAKSSDIGDRSKGKMIQNIHNENSSRVRLSMPSFPANKRVQASFDLTTSKVDSPGKPVKSSNTRGSRGNGVYVSTGSQSSTHDANKENFVDEENPSLPPFLWSRDQPCQNGGAEEIDVNQLMQTLPDSPPTFDKTKDSDDDNNDQGSEQSTKRLSAKGASKKEPKYGTNLEAQIVLPSSPDADPSTGKLKGSRKCNVNMNEGQNSPVDEDSTRESNVNMNERQNSPVDEDSTREPKKQKKSNCGLNDMVQSFNTPFHMNDNQTAKCAFCQSSKETEASGQMLHYANGSAVLEYQASQSNVLHAHKRCIEWAPQVYFVGETAVNLEAEVARGKKIKCSICAKRGAALGCFAKSCRRSFHVPCAAEIPDCRWDHDNFLMFCPMHSSFKLPNGRSKSGKKRRANHSSVTQLVGKNDDRQITDPKCKRVSPQTLGSSTSSTTQESNKPWMASPGGTREWVLCGSALSITEKDLVTEFANLIGATVTKDWKPNVTHVIASTDDMGACSRTFKFLMAILSGKWILKIDWVKACMEAMRPVNEEPYEISRDVHGCSGGPKNGRIRILDKAPKLFSGLNLYFFGDFVPSYKGYLKDLVIAAGGSVQVKEYADSRDSKTKTTPAANVVVYNRDPPQNCKSSQLSSVIEQRHVEAETFAAKTGSQVVDHTWLLESIAACKLQPLPC